MPDANNRLIRSVFISLKPFLNVITAHNVQAKTNPANLNSLDASLQNKVALTLAPPQQINSKPNPNATAKMDNNPNFKVTAV